MQSDDVDAQRPLRGNTTVYAPRRVPVRPDDHAATAIIGPGATLIATSGNWERITAIDTGLGFAESVWKADLEDLRRALTRTEQHLAIALRVGRLVRTTLVHLHGVYRGGVWFVVARRVLPGPAGDDAAVSVIEAQGADDLVLIIHPGHHRVTYANRAAQLAGVRRGDDWVAWVAASDRTRVAAAFARWLAGDSRVPLWESVPVLGRSGDGRWFVLVAVHIGEAGVVCCLAMDVTPLREAAGPRPTRFARRSLRHLRR